MIKNIIFSGLLATVLTITACSSGDSFMDKSASKLPPDTLSGQTTGTQITFSASVIDFGSRSINSINYIPINLTNTGATIATQFIVTGYTAPVGFHDGDANNGTNTCGGGIPAGKSCTFLVTFIPTALTAISQTLTVSYFDGSSTKSNRIQVMGSGNGVASLQIVDPANPFSVVADFGQNFLSNPSVTKTLLVKYGGLSSPGAVGVTFSKLANPFSIQSTSCVAEQNKDCQIVVNYAPTTLGTTTLPLKVTYNNYAQTASSAISVTGKTVNKPTVPAGPSLVFQSASGGAVNGNFGKKLIRSTFVRSFKVVNAGAASAIQISSALSSSSFSFTGAGYPGANGTCNAGLAGGSSCLIEVQFKTDATASAVGATVNANVAFTYSDGTNFFKAALPLSGSSGNAAKISVINPANAAPAADPYDMGAWSVGFSVNSVFVAGNDPQSVDANITAIKVFQSQFGYGGGCGGQLSSGGACAFNVNFRPDAANGTSNKAFADHIELDYGDLDQDGTGAQAVTRNISGQGKPDALLIFNGVGNPYFNWKAINTETILPITVSYFGTLPASNLVTSGLTAPFSYVGPYGSNPCGGTVTANCTVGVKFSPTTAGTFTQTLSLTYDNGLGGAGIPTQVTIQGTSYIPTGQLSFHDGSGYNFGNLGAGIALTQTFKVDWSGEVDVTSAAASISASAAFQITNNTCTSTVTSSGCSITVAVNLPAPGYFNATVVLNYFDGAQNQVRSFNLYAANVAYLYFSGNGGFGKLPMNQSAMQTFTLNNGGMASGVSLAFCGGTGLSAPYTIVSNTCSSAVPASGSCQIGVKFLPTTPGVQNAQLCYTYNDGANNNQVSVALSGAGTAPMQVSAGGSHTCMLSDINELYCFGDNAHGQLGVGDDSPRGLYSNQMASLPKVPLNLPAGVYLSQLAVGGNHTCALGSNGAVWCWGANDFGQLGNGDNSGSKVAIGDEANEVANLLPVDLGAGNVAIAVAAGYEHTCAITNGTRGNGTVVCWGENSYGKLGRGDNRSIGGSSGDMGSHLVAVPLLKPAKQLALDTGHSCALLNDGSVECWGYNNWGQLGQGSQLTLGDQPNQISQAKPVRLGANEVANSVAVGGAFSGIIDTAGKIKLWGHNSEGLLGMQWCEGNLGYGPCSDARFPTPISAYGDHVEQMGDALPFVNLGNNVTVKSLVAGGNFSCAMVADAGGNLSVKCWGQNESGQLGKGNTTSVGTDASQMGVALVNVNLNGAVPVSITAGESHVCALTTGNQIFCWGNNQFGQLGVNNAVNVGDQANEMGANLVAVQR